MAFVLVVLKSVSLFVSFGKSKVGRQNPSDIRHPNSKILYLFILFASFLIAVSIDSSGSIILDPPQKSGSEKF
jgi:hypothetical protein